MNQSTAVKIMQSLEGEFIAAANYALEKQIGAIPNQKSKTGILGIDIVTDVDLEVQEIVLKALATTEFFNATLIAEEDTPSRALFTGTSEYSITLDPIDGTKHYIDGDPNFSLILGLLYDGEPIYTFAYYPSGHWLHRIIDSGYTSTPPPEWTLQETRNFSQQIASSYENEDISLFNQDVQKLLLLLDLQVKNAWSNISGELDANELLFLNKAAGYVTTHPNPYDGIVIYHLAKLSGWHLFKVHNDLPIFDSLTKKMNGYVTIRTTK